MPQRKKSLRDSIYSLGEAASVALVSRHRPGRFARIFFKFPVWLHRLGLGRFMGGSLVILTTTGRRSGLPRQTALSNFGFDEDTGAYYVASGWGGRSDWFLNLQANPGVGVQVDRKRFDATAEVMPEDVTVGLLGDYLRRYPSVARAWPRRVGVDYDGSEASLRQLAAQIHIVALRPVNR